MSVFGGLLFLGLVGLVWANPYLDVQLKAHAPFYACEDVARCNVSYSLVLLHSNSRHSLQSVRLQEPSALRKTRDDTFEEQTVVALSRSLRRGHAKMFIGVQLYDLPDGTQDFYLVDVSNTIHLGERAKILVTSEDFSLSVVVHRRHESALMPNAAAPNGCHCVTKNCGCCEHLVIHKIHLDDNVCVNISYISEDIGIKMSFSINDYVYYSEEISVRNPPPICFSIPHLHQFASICIKLYDVETSRTRIKGCVELDAHLYHVQVARKQLGCFAIPI